MKMSHYVIYVCILLLIALFIHHMFFSSAKEEGFANSSMDLPPSAIPQIKEVTTESEETTDTASSLPGLISETKNLYTDITGYMNIISGILDTNQNKAYQSAMYYQYVTKTLSLPLNIQSKYSQIVSSIEDISKNYIGIQKANASIMNVYNQLMDLSNNIQINTSSYSDASFAYYTSVQTHQSLKNNKSIDVSDVDVAKRDMTQKNADWDKAELVLNQSTAKYNESILTYAKEVTQQMDAMKSTFAIIKQSIGNMDVLINELNTLTGYTSGKMILDTDCMNHA